MRLIDGEELLARYKARCNGCKETKNYCEHCCDIADIINDIEDAPTIEERKKGKWLLDPPEGTSYRLYKCSVCGYLWLHWWASAMSVEKMAKEVRCCPNCGADMREEKTDDGNNDISKDS